MSYSVPLIPAWREGCGSFLEDYPPSYKHLSPHMTILTKPLRVGQHIDLLGISGDANAICEGLIDHTDSVKGPVRLETLIFRNTENDSLLTYVVDPATTTEITGSVPGHESLKQLRLDFFTELSGEERKRPWMVFAFYDVELTNINIDFPLEPIRMGDASMELVGYTITATRGR